MSTNIAQSLLPELEMEIANTRKVLERIPADKFAYKPHEKSFSMIGLATHIANMTNWGTVTASQDEFDFAPIGAEPYKEEPAESVAALVAQFDKAASEFKAALANTTDEAMMKEWRLLAGGNVVMAMPRIACLRGMIMNHLIHHRAQLCVYLRMNDVPVPAIYGPSADEGGM